MIAFKDKTLKDKSASFALFHMQGKACCKAIRKVFRCILKKFRFMIRFC